MTEVITKVRKFLSATTADDLAALIQAHEVQAWHRVGDLICAESGLMGFGRYRQVMEKDMPDRVSSLLFQNERSGDFGRLGDVASPPDPTPSTVDSFGWRSA